MAKNRAPSTKHFNNRCFFFLHFFLSHFFLCFQIINLFNYGRRLSIPMLGVHVIVYDDGDIDTSQWSPSLHLHGFVELLYLLLYRTNKAWTTDSNEKLETLNYVYNLPSDRINAMRVLKQRILYGHHVCHKAPQNSGYKSSDDVDDDDDREGQHMRCICFVWSIGRLELCL